MLRLGSRTTRTRGARTAVLLGALLTAASIFVAAPAGAASQTVKFSLTPVYFGSVVIGTSSSGESIVTNNSLASLYFISATPSNSNTGAEFHGSRGTCVGALAVGASCDVDVVFAPNTHGLRASTLTVRFGEKNLKGKFTNEASFHTTIQGHGVKPTFSLTGASAGSVVVGQIGTAYAVVTNTSPVELTVKKVALQGVEDRNFVVASDTCPSPVLPGGSCDIVLAFRPNRTGSASVTLTVSMHLQGTSGTLLAKQSTITGSGERSGGASPAFTLSPLNFGTVTVGTTASGEVVLSNTSAFTETFDKAVLGSDATGAYAIASNGCGSIAAGANCDITIDYSPAGAVTHNSTLVAKVTYVNAKSKTVSPSAQTSLTGKGIQPDFSLKASSFPATTIGASSSGTVTVTNNSLVPLSFASQAFQGADQSSWAFGGSACVNPIQPSQSCELDISFNPLGQGTLSVTFQVDLQLTVRSNTIDVIRRTPLSGVGVLPTFGLTAPSLGSTPKGVSETGQAQVTNTSSVSLTYSSSSFTGPNASDFSVISTTCSGAIAPTKDCDLVVKFTPSAASPGSESATLKAVFDIDGTPGPVTTSNTVQVSGTES
jgi:hypothetical protein